MFRQTTADLLQYVHNGRVVVVAGNADDDIRCVDLFDALGRVRPKGRVVIHSVSTVKRSSAHRGSVGELRSSFFSLLPHVGQATEKQINFGRIFEKSSGCGLSRRFRDENSHAYIRNGFKRRFIAALVSNIDRQRG